MFRQALRQFLPSRYDAIYVAYGMAAAFFLTVLAPAALAGQAVPPDPGMAGMSHGAWEWFLFGTATLGYLSKWVDPSNTATPGNWPAKWRVAGFTVLGALVGLAQFVTKDPSVAWTESLATGAATILVPMALHFSTLLSKGTPAVQAAAKAAGFFLLLGAGGALAVTQAGCSAAQKQTETTVANAVLTDANKVCLGIEAALPLLGLPAPTVAEANQVCNIVGVADPVIQSFLDNALAAATPAVTQAQAKLAARAHGKW